MKCIKHIVWITPGFAASEADDFTIPAMQTLALEIRKQNPETKFTIIAIHFPYKEEIYNWNGITVHAIGGANGKFPFRFLTWRKVNVVLAKIHKESKIDLIHSFWLSEAALLAQKFCGRLGIKHVSTLMGQDTLPSNRYLKFLKLYSISKVAQSDRSANQFLETTGKKTDAVIPFGIDSFKLTTGINREIDIIGVGSLSEIKNYGKFIEIISLVKKILPEVSVILIGEGPQLVLLQQEVQRRKLSENIILKGRLSRDETLVWMQKSKIFLHTSNSEGMGYVFFEAAMCGCNIVSTPVGIVANDQFTFVESNVNEMAKEIVKWLTTKQEYKSREVYSIEQSAKEYLSLYQKSI